MLDQIPKIFKAVILVLFIPVGHSLFAQQAGKIYHEYDYYLNDQKAFSRNWSEKRPNLDTFKIYKGERYADTTILENFNNKQLIAYDSDDGNLFFLLKEKDSIKMIKEVTGILLDSAYNLTMRPERIYSYDFDKDGLGEVVARFIHDDAFKIVIYKWKLTRDKIGVKKIYESDFFFAYGMFHPFRKLRGIIFNDNEIIIPYCEGCDDSTNKNDVEKEVILKYNKNLDDFYLIQ